MRRRLVTVVILLYIALDLSWAQMPGAFEFDPTESVESTADGPARKANALDVLAHEHHATPMPARMFDRPRPHPIRNIGAPLTTPTVAIHFVRDVCATPRPAEEPH